MTTSYAVSISKLTEEEIHSLSYSHNVIKESLRLFLQVYLFPRIATKGGQVPTMYPVHNHYGNIVEGKRSERDLCLCCYRIFLNWTRMCVVKMLNSQVNFVVLFPFTSDSSHFAFSHRYLIGKLPGLPLIF